MPKQTFFNLKKVKQEKIMTAAYKEFSTRSFQHAKISNIISMSKIPRGSFYQYFNDKKDLYLYIFQVMGEEKMKYLGNILSNPDDISFIDLFHEIYKKSIKFTVKNPTLMKIFQKLVLANDGIYKELIGDNLKKGVDYYVMMIEKDKEKGIIRKDLNSKALAELVIQVTTSISVEAAKNDNFNSEDMLQQAENLIDLLKYGIENKS